MLPRKKMTCLAHRHAQGPTSPASCEITRGPARLSFTSVTRIPSPFKLNSARDLTTHRPSRGLSAPGRPLQLSATPGSDHLTRRPSTHSVTSAPSVEQRPALVSRIPFVMSLNEVHNRVVQLSCRLEIGLEPSDPHRSDRSCTRIGACRFNKFFACRAGPRFQSIHAVHIQTPRFARLDSVQLRSESSNRRNLGCLPHKADSVGRRMSSRGSVGEAARERLPHGLGMRAHTRSHLAWREVLRPERSRRASIRPSVARARFRMSGLRARRTTTNARSGRSGSNMCVKKSSADRPAKVDGAMIPAAIRSYRSNPSTHRDEAVEEFCPPTLGIGAVLLEHRAPSINTVERRGPPADRRAFRRADSAAARRLRVDPTGDGADRRLAVRAPAAPRLLCSATLDFSSARP